MTLYLSPARATDTFPEASGPGTNSELGSWPRIEEAVVMPPGDVALAPAYAKMYTTKPGLLSCVENVTLHENRPVLRKGQRLVQATHLQHQI